MSVRSFAAAQEGLTPARAANAVKRLQPLPRPNEVKPQPLPSSSPAVLLLEPDEKLQQLIRVILGHDGFIVVTATSGDRAVREYRRRNFSAFIVDISIWASFLERGARRGVGFLHFLQRIDPSVLERVVVTSALNDRDLPTEMPPVHRLIHKPFDINELRKAVAECALATAGVK